MTPFNQISIFGFIPFSGGGSQNGTDIKGPVPENENVTARSHVNELCEEIGLKADLRGSMPTHVYLDNLEKIVVFLLQREVERSK